MPPPALPPLLASRRSAPQHRGKPGRKPCADKTLAHVSNVRSGNRCRNNWLGVDFVGDTTRLKNGRVDPFPAAPVITQKAGEAYQLVLKDVGATRPIRDAQDARVIQEVTTGTARFGNRGIIDSQREVGGWPLLRSKPAPEDTDKDGMPDTWEQTHGLDALSPTDRNAKTIDPSYTNLEVYLNSLASLPRRGQLRVQRTGRTQ